MRSTLVPAGSIRVPGRTKEQSFYEAQPGLVLPVWPRRFSESLAYSGRFQRGDTRPGHYAGTIYCFVMQGSTICHNMQVRSRQ